jgi:hypothetical protein
MNRPYVPVGEKRNIDADADGPVVIAEIQQGLGNQLFQYAMGLAVARRLGGATLLLDRRWYTGHRQRRFLLSEALDPLYAQVATPRAIDQRLARADVQRIGEPDMGFQDIALAGASSCVHLSGWWQNHRYVQPVADLLDASLARVGSFRPPARSVGVHVRGWDYRLHDVYQVVGRAYYQRAFDVLDQLAPGCEVFVFTDDPAYARDILPDGLPSTLMATRNAIVDLANLARCAHQIIPNSTFGWWAGFFNPNPHKRVLMPSCWFNPAHATPYHRAADLGAPYAVRVEADERLLARTNDDVKA